MGLGPLNAVSLKQAREKARACRAQRADGLDPIEARAVVRASTAAVATFEAVARDYLALQGPALSPAHQQQWQASLVNYAFPIIGAMPVAAVDIDSVFKVLAPLWTTKSTRAIA
jgi:hypothetical protein